MVKSVAKSSEVGLGGTPKQCLPLFSVQWHMKHNIKTIIAAILVAILAATPVSAQQFSANIWFGIFPGNHSYYDTVVIGYDAQATDTLDTQFGEQNIIGNAWDTMIDVRLSNIWGLVNNPAYYGQTPYQTRKQITPDRCGTNIPSTLELSIKSARWPVYVYWNRTEFGDSCRRGTSLTDMPPAEWWNGNGFREVLAIWNYHPIYPNRHYTIQGNDTIYTYWIGLGDSESVALKLIDPLPDNQPLTLYPNPATNLFTVQIPDNFKTDYIALYSPDGKMLLQTTNSIINTDNLTSGIYYVHLVNTNRQRLIGKLMKL